VPLEGIEPPRPVPKTGVLSVELQRLKELISAKIIQQMTDFTQTIEEIEKEIRETPYHKGTEHHIGKLRARLARLKDKEYEYEVKRSGGGGGGGYAVKKHGDATVVLVGPPSVGKSTLINQITNAESKVAAYAFTTISVIPGMLKYKGAYIQIFDIPGIITGASLGKGRGKEVLSVARASDLLVIMIDVERINLLEKIVSELEASGIRINKEKPQIKIEKKVGGGIVIHSNIKQEVSNETIKEISSEFGLKNAEITIKEKLNIDSLIDAFSTSRIYLPAIFVANKADKIKSGGKKLKDILYISAEKGAGLEEFKETLWDTLNLTKVYLVREDEKPNLNDPIIVKGSYTLEDVAEKISVDFAEKKRLAKIWGPGALFPGQEVSLTTRVKEGMQIKLL
jgi:small GTP-binding protein